MRIYLLTNLDQALVGQLDCVDKFVLLAYNPQEARIVAAEAAGDEGSVFWLTSPLVLCEEIGEALPIFSDPRVFCIEGNGF
jgi:hypothetical protein